MLKSTAVTSLADLFIIEIDQKIFELDFKEEAGWTLFHRLGARDESAHFKNFFCIFVTYQLFLEKRIRFIWTIF